jgi:hypothetical protein
MKLLDGPGRRAKDPFTDILTVDHDLHVETAMPSFHECSCVDVKDWPEIGCP